MSFMTGSDGGAPFPVLITTNHVLVAVFISLIKADVLLPIVIVFIIHKIIFQVLHIVLNIWQSHLIFVKYSFSWRFTR